MPRQSHPSPRWSTACSTSCHCPRPTYPHPRDRRRSRQSSLRAISRSRRPATRPSPARVLRLANSAYLSARPRGSIPSITRCGCSDMNADPRYRARNLRGGLAHPPAQRTCSTSIRFLAHQRVHRGQCARHLAIGVRAAGAATRLFIAGLMHNIGNLDPRPPAAAGVDVECTARSPVRQRPSPTTSCSSEAARVLITPTSARSCCASGTAAAGTGASRWRWHTRRDSRGDRRAISRSTAVMHDRRRHRARRGVAIDRTASRCRTTIRSGHRTLTASSTEETIEELMQPASTPRSIEFIAILMPNG